MTPVDKFDFHLPEELIALYPNADRSASRLLYVPKEGQLQNQIFKDILKFLRPNDLLVLNDSKVIQARLYARKPGGGKVEMLVERLIDQRRILAQLKSNKRMSAGSEFHVESVHFRVEGQKDGLFEVRIVSGQNIESVLGEYGQVPLPPYIKRASEAVDRVRYQTVYARHPGSVAAPTAGLHFDAALLEAVAKLGVQCARLTLHIGAGTFQPIRTETVESHRMHRERIQIEAALVESIRQCRAAGGRVIAVGSTVLRALESVADEHNQIKPFVGETDIFIRPGYRFRVVDVMITNFHLPKSSLFVLVCAFAGYQKILDTYQYAIEQGYRFYSYGDAMWLECASVSPRKAA